MYIFFGIFILICIFFAVFFHRRRKRIIQKIRNMSPCAQKKLLDELMQPFGFLSCPQQNIITSDIDSWQRTFGYTRLFDYSAPHFKMVFDCEPVYFDYDNRTWLIEFWKGQYGISCGAEIGIYRADTILSPDRLTNARFESISNSLMLPLSMQLFYQGRPLFCIAQTHWWLTGFRPGFFAYPQDLSLRISITFLDREMADSFADALIAKGYCPYDIELCSASVAFTFGTPHSFQPRCKRPFVTHMAQRVNRIYCRIFNKITRPFANCYEQILYLYFYLPFAFRRLLRMKRHKTQKFHRCRR